MRLVDLIILAGQEALEISKHVLKLIKKDPSLVFSYTKLLKAIKDDRMSSSTNSPDSSSVTNLNTPRKGRKKVSS